MQLLKVSVSRQANCSNRSHVRAFSQVSTRKKKDIFEGNNFIIDKHEVGNEKVAEVPGRLFNNTLLN